MHGSESSKVLAESIQGAKTRHYQRVERFMRKIMEGGGFRIPREIGDLEARRFRARLILEEVLELLHTGLGVTVRGLPDTVDGKTEWLEIGPGDIVDGCMDVSVVITGCMVTFGVPDADLLKMVDDNNLEKFRPGHSFDKGKLVKLADHEKPRIREWLEAGGYFAK